jgi:hypothetical protein
VVGHVLGVQDDLMPASYDDATASSSECRRSVARRRLLPDARPGLGQALMQAMAQAIRLPVIRGIPVPLCQWLIGRPVRRATSALARRRPGRCGWPSRDRPVLSGARPAGALGQADSFRCRAC